MLQLPYPACADGNGNALTSRILLSESSRIWKVLDQRTRQIVPRRVEERTRLQARVPYPTRPAWRAITGSKPGTTEGTSAPVTSQTTRPDKVGSGQRATPNLLADWRVVYLGILGDSRLWNEDESYDKRVNTRQADYASARARGEGSGIPSVVREPRCVGALLLPGPGPVRFPQLTGHLD